MIDNIDYNKVNNDFNKYYQASIDTLKQGHPQFGNTPSNVIINIQADVLWGKIPKTQRLGNFTKYSEHQKAVFYKALIQQIYYVLKEGDFSDMSGYDVSNNTLLSATDMEKVAVSKAAMRTLMDGGLLYRGTGYNIGVRWI
jgi:hypothetical protein